MQEKEKQSGFTLIEVLIVVTITGLILGVAMPSYLESQKDSRRADATAELVQIMQLQERHFANNRTYTIDLTDLGYATSPVTSEKALYTIAASACAGGIARCVELTATPQGKQAGDGTISLNSKGEKAATGDAQTADVWS